MALVAQCSKLNVTDAQSYEAAAGKRVLVKSAIEYFEGLYRPRVDEAYRHHRSLLADLKKFTEPLQTVYDRIGKLMAYYDSQMEARRQQEQREADRKAEEEKAAAAAVARELGAEEAAKKIEQAPPEPTVVAKTTPKIEGLHYTETKHYAVEDLKALVKAVAEGKAPIGAIDFNKGFINKQTHALFDSVEPDKKGVKWLYPGVKIWSTRTPVQKG
jgi:hypothetical protein